MAYGSFEADGIEVQSSIHSSEEMAANLAPVVDDTVVETDDAPAEDVAPIEAKTEPKPKPRNDPQARVEQATAKEAAAKRERDEAKAEAADLKARLAALEAKAPKAEPKPVVAADPEPTVDQFDSYEKFVKAQARWEARQEIVQQEAERQQHAARQQREYAIREVDRQFGERYGAILAKDPEFPSKVDARLLNTPRMGVLDDPSKATFGNFLVEQVFQSEQPEALLLHLSDPQVVQRLATLPPNQVIRELAKVELSVTAASPTGPAVKTPAISRAKPPIQPVGSSPLAADANEISDDLSVDEHIKRMNARDRAARRAS